MLLIGAILAPGTRTVASLLRICGLAGERRFVNHHRILNRAVWSSRAASRLLLRLLIDAFAPDGPVVMGIDDTIERRRGRCIAAKGIYRDPVRSSHGHFVKASGLRWLSLMLLVPIPWAERIWALPFLTARAPSERHSREHGRRHKRLTDWGRQVVLQARRWLPRRDLVLVADSSFAALKLLAVLNRRSVVCVTRLRLDAALYTPAPPRLPGAVGRPPTKGKRLPNLSGVLADAKATWQCITAPGWYGQGERTVELCSGTAVWRHAGLPVVPIRWVLVRDPLGRFKPQALLCTDPGQSPQQVLCWFVQRWQLEATFQEVRAHLGVETQRQWSDLAIARTTPCLLALFSLVTLLTAQLGPKARRSAQEGYAVGRCGAPVLRAAWQARELPVAGLADPGSERGARHGRAAAVPARRMEQRCDRCARAGVPDACMVPKTKSQIALDELDRVQAAGARFGTVLADAGYGTSAAFRHGLDERGLAWAVGGSPGTRKSTRPTCSSCRPAGEPASSCRIRSRKQLRTCWQHDGSVSSRAGVRMLDVEHAVNHEFCMMLSASWAPLAKR